MEAIPFLDLKGQHRRLKGEIMALWEEILDGAGFIGGVHVQAFEEEFARACDAERCVLVNSGTDALRLIFLALGLSDGDEVITAPNTFIATTEAISQAGGRVVFVDVDPRTYTMDPEKLEAAVTGRTKGVVPVHLYGQCADMDPIMEIADRHGLWVVEDACQAHLARYKGRMAGSMGIAGAFSFYPGKNLGACGEAGAVVTSDSRAADIVLKLRDHGQGKKYFHDIEGFNARCDALQAAALRVKLKHLPEWNDRRRANARIYFDLLKDAPGIVLPAVNPDCLHVFHLFVVLLEHRDRVQTALGEKNIASGLHYPTPLHLQKAYEYMKLGPGAFPAAESSTARLLSLPMFPELEERQIQRICDCLRASTSS